jgi:hypothetical protein
MREPFRDGKRALVLLVQLGGYMLQITGALGAEIHDNVQNCTASAAHQFGFSRRRVLEMQAAQRPFPKRRRNIDLRNYRFQTVRLEFILAKGPRKKASLVLSALQIDDECAFELGFGENQNGTR